MAGLEHGQVERPSIYFMDYTANSAPDTKLGRTDTDESNRPEVIYRQICIKYEDVSDATVMRYFCINSRKIESELKKFCEENGFLAEDCLLYKSETINSEHKQALLNRFQTMYIDNPSYLIDGPYLDKFTKPYDPDPESETESEEDHDSDGDYINSSESDNEDDII